MTIYSVYSVAPFSLWKRNGTKVKGITGRECAICGKLVREPFQHVAIVIDGGARWGTPESDRSDSGYMGEHPIGPDCHKKYRLP